MPRAWHQRRNFLHLEEEVLGLRAKRVTRAASAARGRRQAQAAGGRPLTRSPNPAGDRANKSSKASPSARARAVEPSGVRAQSPSSGRAGKDHSQDFGISEPAKLERSSHRERSTTIAVARGCRIMQRSRSTYYCRRRRSARRLESRSPVRLNSREDCSRSASGSMTAARY